MAEEQQPKFINVRDTDTGEIGSYPASQQQDLIGKGYEPVSDLEVKEYLKEQQYGTGTQKAKAALEGALSAATFGLSTGAEMALGVEPEAIKARAEVNPFTHGLGEAAGLIGSSFLIPGGGAAGAMEAAGAAAAAKTSKAAANVYEAKKALDLARETGVGIEQAQAAVKVAKEAQPFIAKVGSEAANQAVQFGMMQAGDEVSKSFVDPEHTFGAAATEVGLSGLIGGVVGGALGTVSPLWKATLGPKTENFLNKLKNRADGVSIPVNPDLEYMLKDAAPEIRSRFSQDPQMQSYAKDLIESGTPAGDAFRETLEKFKEKLQTDVSDIFKVGEGKTPYEVGEETKEFIKNAANEVAQERKAAYGVVKDIELVTVPEEIRYKTRENLINNAENFGSKGNEKQKLFKDWGDKILAQETIGDLDKLWTEANTARQNAVPVIGEKDYLKANIMSEIMEKIRTLQNNYLDKTAMDIAKATGDVETILAAELAKDQRAAARASHVKFKETIGELAGLANIKGATDVGQLGIALDKIPNIKLAEKLFDKKNIEKLELLKNEYPNIFQKIVDLQKNDLLNKASKSGHLNHTTLIRSINDLPKETQNLLFTKEELATIKNSVDLLQEANIRKNPSGTSRARDVATAHLGAGVASIVATLTGHNPIVAAILGEAAQRLGVDAPAAIKLSLLKFLGSSGEISSPGFKALVDYTHAVYQGEKAINKVAKQVFTLGTEVTARGFEQQDRARIKLQKKIDEINNDPAKLIETGGDASVYAPDHAFEMSKTASNAVNYLNSLKPKQEKQTFLDSKPAVNQVEQARYNRALDIAGNPLIVLESVRNGTITQNDVNDLKAMFPGAYRNMQGKVIEQMTIAMEKGTNIPYQTRLGLSVFMGQPLDSTMQPQSILATQNQVAPNQMQGQTIPGQQPKHSFNSLSKMPGMYQTPGQARQQDKLGR